MRRPIILNQKNVHVKVIFPCLKEEAVIATLQCIYVFKRGRGEGGGMGRGEGSGEKLRVTLRLPIFTITVTNVNDNSIFRWQNHLISVGHIHPSIRRFRYVPL